MFMLSRKRITLLSLNHESNECSLGLDTPTHSLFRVRRDSASAYDRLNRPHNIDWPLAILAAKPTSAIFRCTAVLAHYSPVIPTWPTILEWIQKQKFSIYMILRLLWSVAHMFLVKQMFVQKWLQKIWLGSRSNFPDSNYHFYESRSSTDIIRLIRFDTSSMAHSSRRIYRRSFGTAA
jgi:hypothetical protein